MKAHSPSSGLLSNSANSTAAIMGKINNVTNLRTYGNTVFGVTVFGVSMHYPALWEAVELKSNPFDNESPGSSVALFTAPSENATDTFRENISKY